MTNERWLPVGDAIGRVAIVAYFANHAVHQTARIIDMLANWPELTTAHKHLVLLSQVAILLFLALVIATTIFRLKPLRSSEGIEPRLSALAGTFLLGLLAFAPKPAELPPALTIFALVLIIAGSVLSAYVLRWLGRSFSIMAEARRLVTGGPYAYVRHPLYLTEEITILGVILLNFSPLAVLLGAAHWLLQLRRMHNEERVLRAAFPDYDAYAAVTPRVIPRLSPIPVEKSA
jgi:protein-S-isoprenylcysteine O-methyltransferase Ste14